MQKKKKLARSKLLDHYMEPVRTAKRRAALVAQYGGDADAEHLADFILDVESRCSEAKLYTGPADFDPDQPVPEPADLYIRNLIARATEIEPDRS